MEEAEKVERVAKAAEAAGKAKAKKKKKGKGGAAAGKARPEDDEGEGGSDEEGVQQEVCKAEARPSKEEELSTVVLRSSQVGGGLDWEWPLAGGVSLPVQVAALACLITGCQCCW
jgi:hypothetical protein